ncbi:GNAT family N-acetyltransferase [Desulfobacula sp.]|uniref:GNAT family N-acetyltransferase n=1 Tax=Desulfobacula sp. TaxID=2593537 RepID=UPI0027155325|nr:GNAT family N-acetyltransferase [Desulfobacula sp.]
MGTEIYKIDEEFSIRVVRNLGEFGELKNTWNSLTENYESYLPWLNFDWFELCLKYFLNDNKLFILLLYKADSVVAIAPFVIKKEVLKGVFKTIKIELIGNVYSPIRNFIFGDSSDEDKIVFISKIICYFCDVYKDWDIIEFDKIPEENNVFDMFTHVVYRSALKHRTCFCSGNWYLDGITYTFDKYFENLPRKLQKDIQYCRRRLVKMGDLRFQMKLDDNSLDHYLDIYDEVRKKSWKAPEKDKVFIREFTKIAAEKGFLRLAFLFYENDPIASQKWIVCHKNAYILDVLHDENYRKYSPGKILSSEISKYVIDYDKVNEIDFMGGDDPYKKDWTPNRRERKGITVFNNTIRGQSLAFLMTKVLPVIEKNQYLLSAKNKISGYLKNYRQR